MQKLYYSISEVSKLIDEEQHILRYWEKEFEILRPKKNRAGNRIYSDKDLKILKMIKYLLRQKKISIKGVKEYLAKNYDFVVNSNLKTFEINIDNNLQTSKFEKIKHNQEINRELLISKIIELKNRNEKLLKIIE